MIKHLVLLLSFTILCNSSIIFAQNQLSGTVFDQQSLEPIEGAFIVVKGTSLNATTNNEGKFSFSSSEPILKLTITRLGYQSKEVDVTQNTSVQILLTPSPIQISGVQVVGSSDLLKSQSIGVLTPRDLERTSGLALENSINTIPGVFMQSRTPWGGGRITIRGYYPSTSGNSPNSNGLGYQVFINNIPITDATGSTVLDDIDYSSLGYVEVIKGPSSSIYGSPTGGTINFKTRMPTPNQTGIEEQVTGGSNGLFRNNTSFMSAQENSSIAVNYGYQTYDSFRPHSRSVKNYVRLNGDFNVGANQNLSTYFSYNNSMEELAGEIDSADFYSRMPTSNEMYLANNSHINIESYRLGVTDNYLFSEYFSNQTSLFGSGKTSNQPFAHGFTDVNQFNFGGRTAFNYTSQVSSIGINGTLGVMFQESNLTSNGVFIVPAPPYAQRPSDQENYAMNYYVFTEWNFTLPMDFIVTLGASLNKNEFGIRNMLKNNQVNDTTNLVVKSFDAVITPRIAVSKIFSDEISVYASVSTGYTPPLLSDVVASNGTVDTELEPESAVQYEIGTKGNLLENKLAYELALFDLVNTDKLVRQTSNSVTYTTNAGKQTNKGVEISLSYLLLNNPEQTISLFRPWVTYAYTDAEYDDFKSDNNNSANTVDFSGNDVARVPKNMVNAGLDIESSTGLYLYATYRYVDDVPVTFDNSTYMESYNVLNAKIGYKRQFGEHFILDISAGGDNLLGETYYSFIFVGPNIAGLALPPTGHGDGYIIPAPYDAEYYGNLTINYAF